MDQHKYDQHVSAFKREDCLILISNVKTEAGVWYLHKPVVVLDARTSLPEIGLAVFRALFESQSGVPEPPSLADLDDTTDQILEAASVQSYEHLLENTLHCGVGRDTMGIEITPTHNNGTHAEPKGFRFLFER
ncbi:MAG TPA: hypothetical protein VF177_15835, partial [Anaerolineae bacterium]